MNRACVLGLGMLGLVSCGRLPYSDPDVPGPPANLPPEFDLTTGEPADGKPETEPNQPGASGRAVVSTQQRRWWLHIGDGALRTLIERALSGNFSQRAAWARIEQARAIAEQAAAPRYPQVVPQGDVTWRRSPGTFGDQTVTVLTASLPVRYEVDWFGKYEGQHQAAEYDALAVRADVESAAMTLTANVAETWYNLVETRARQRLLKEQLENNETFLELTVFRFRQGLTSALDAHQQRQQVAATRARLDLVVAEERVFENQLAVLVGAMPTRDGQVVPPRDELPELAPLPVVGAPIDLLTNRPDIRATMQRIRAADERAAAALADRLPSLVLSASVGHVWQWQDFGNGLGGGMGGFQLPDVVKGPQYSAGATLSFPLFDGFQRAAAVDQRRAALQEAAATYRQTVQQAVAEVENAAVQERQQIEHIRHLEEQLEAASDALESARDNYREGLADFLNVLTSLQNQQQSELSLLGARRQLLSYRIQLYRALGGSWTQALDAPPKAEIP